MTTFFRRYQIVLVLYVAFVFIQSLVFKFADSPETQYIFGTLNEWTGGSGTPGLFALACGVFFAINVHHHVKVVTRPNAGCRWCPGSPS